MRKLNPPLRNFILLVIGLGLLAVVISPFLPKMNHPDLFPLLAGRGADDTLATPTGRLDFLLIVLGCLCALLASYVKVTLYRVPTRSKSGSSEPAAVNRVTMSLSHVPIFLLLFSLGLFPGILAAIFGSQAAKTKTPLYKRFFNAAVLAVSALISGLVTHSFGLAPGVWNPFASAGSPASPDAATQTFAPLVGVAVAASVYYLVNTGLVATAVALSSGKSPIPVWREFFLGTAPGYYAGASGAALMLAILTYMSGESRNPLPWFALCIVLLPTLIAIFFGYKYHAQLDEANQARIESLRQSADELARKNGELERSKDELQRLYMSTVESLALAIDAKDRYTKEHIQRVKVFAVAIAEEMGLTGDALKAVETGALLHDIGKLAVPEHILTKPGRLSEEEFVKVKAHPDMGARILEPVQFPFPVMPIVRHHHERWDGKGYPDGLRGEEIPLGGRILAVADVYDALTSDRSYRKGWPHERALAHLREHAGTHFDPLVVDAFLAAMERDPALDIRSAAAAAASASGSLDGSVGSAAAERRGETAGTVAEGINRASFEYLAVYEVSQVATAARTLDETLHLVAERIRTLFNASSCVVLLRDLDGTPSSTSSLAPPSGTSLSSSSGLLLPPPSNPIPLPLLNGTVTAAASAASPLGSAPGAVRLRVHYAAGEVSELFEGASAALVFGGGDGASSGSSRGGEPLVVFRRPDLEGMVGGIGDDDIDADEGVDAMNEDAAPAFRSALIAPLLVDGELLGTVNLYHRRPHAFDREDQRVLQTVAGTAGHAIRNALDFDRTRESALTDSLTGLRNARHLHQFLVRELERAEREERQLTVLVLDLDNFKPVNDRFGHARGNEVLRDLGRIFQSVLRNGDLVARYAGDEFVIVLPNTGVNEVGRVIDKIRALLRSYDPRPSGAELVRLEIGVSIGAATYPEDGTDAHALINAADRAMFEDKNERKGRMAVSAASPIRLLR